ncbi:hypothetical protein N7466_008957 [Penicillium verhagenii]|uniref:uncharacterized protein n=1 Tax=Penicillium verhagenii TaxID=1562060 RepID=UPI0025456C61|nr:uncharacterized protein N7466_008957 [Penicillium verhagenii]KAJ5924770.1 hypothetical protein N7466_008957 [Penicillium verhagenii]
MCLVLSVCATDDIKNRQVDYYTGATYKDTNLDEDPCIFPQCGHFLALTSMDAQMDLKNHYELDADGKPTALLKSSQPFSMEDMKTCGICRGPLRNLARYGRLIRRALLDESTKKLILLLNREFVPLAKSLADGIQELRNNRHPEMSRWPAVQIKGQSLAQIKEMVGVMNSVSPRRWANMLDLRVRIMKYLANIRPQEQPFQKVWEMVIMAKRQKKTTGDFEFDNGILQVKGLLQGAALSLRLDIALLSDFLALEKSTITKDQVLQIDLEHLRCDCRHLTGKAISGERRVHQVEGLIFEAELYALERAYVSREVGDIYLQKGAHCVSEARKVCQAYPGQTSGLPSEIENAEKMLLEGRFYAGVTSQERMDIIEAMAVTFQGSGHWYYCRNNHPFTIGECGAPMEEASCPECGAPVGGQDHMPVTGVVRAEDYDTQS